MPRKTSLKKRKSIKKSRNKTFKKQNTFFAEKSRNLIGSFRGGSCRDVFGLRGKKLCSDRYTYYFGECFSQKSYWIYTLCEDIELSSCDKYLVKIRPISSMEHAYIINDEARYMEVASRLGIAPEVIGVDFCPAGTQILGLILMEKYGEGTLYELYNTAYFREHTKEIKEKLKYILDILYDNGIDHNDLHSGNFLYSLKDGRPELKIIDFGNAKPFIPGSERKYKIEIGFKYLNVD